MMMKNVVRLLSVLSLFVSLSAFAAAPKFAGEIWAGSEVIAESGPVNVYWVFDSGSFHEYVYYLRTDEMRLLTTGRYQVCPSNDGADVYALQFVRVTPDEGPGKTQMRARRIELTRTAGALTFPAGDRLSRVDGFTQSVPPIERAGGVVRTLGTLKPQPAMYNGCCSDCFAVHDFLGISWLNGICCGGGCGSSGGGGGGGW